MKKKVRIIICAVFALVFLPIFLVGCSSGITEKDLQRAYEEGFDSGYEAGRSDGYSEACGDYNIAIENILCDYTGYDELCRLYEDGYKNFYDVAWLLDDLQDRLSTLIGY